MTTKEAAADLGVSAARIRALIDQGRIAALRRPRIGAGGSEWLIDPASLDSVRDLRSGKASPIYGRKIATDCRSWIR